MKLFGIIGYPLEHTLSPFFHMTLFRRYGIDASYDSFPISSTDVARYVDKIRTGLLCGLSVTAPYKYEAYKYCDMHSPSAQKTQLVNTLSLYRGNIYGDNFDIAGIMDTIVILKKRAGIRSNVQSVLIIGSGATAVSAIIAVSRIGYEKIYVLGRSVDRLCVLRERYGIIPICYQDSSSKNQWDSIDQYAMQTIDSIPWCSLIITTVRLEHAQGISVHMLGRCMDTHTLAIDVHYAPRYSLFLRYAMDKGCLGANGYHMFITQARYQYLRWTGILPIADDIDDITTYYMSIYPS